MKLDFIREKLLTLKNSYSIVALKTGTEIEDMSMEEILLLRKISDGILPIAVKIGGPEARQDIRNLLKLKIDIILAPMIESAYALHNFVETVLDLSQNEGYEPILGFNLETIIGFQNIDAILGSKMFEKVRQVTIGRTDLAGSIGLAADDDKVIEYVCKIISKIKKYNRPTSVGGNLSTQNIERLLSHIPTNLFNTRHIIFQNNKYLSKRPVKILLEVLSWEKILYQFLMYEFPEKKEYFKHRIKVLDSRM